MLGEDEELLEAIVFVLQSPSALESFNISGNNFDSVDIEAIISIINSQQRKIALCGENILRETVDLRHNNLQPHDCSLLSTTMHRPPSSLAAHTLILSDNIGLGNGGIRNVQSVLVGCGVESLHLSAVDISPEDARCLGHILRHPHCTLTTLDISRNGAAMLSKGFRFIASALKVNTSLTQLDMTASVPLSADLVELGEALRCNKVLLTDCVLPAFPVLTPIISISYRAYGRL